MGEFFPYPARRPVNESRFRGSDILEVRPLSWPVILAPLRLAPISC